MEENEEWVESKAKESKGHNFVKTLLGLAGYKIMEYGIENHNQDIIKEITGNYDSDTNKRLMCMPDFVVVDPDTKVAELVEVKYREMPDYWNWEKSNLWFKYRKMKAYLDNWKDMTLIIVLNVEPYCFCIRMSDIDWCNHFKGKRDGGHDTGYLDELWNFYGSYKDIKDVFPKINVEHFKKTLDILSLNKEEKE